MSITLKKKLYEFVGKKCHIILENEVQLTLGLGDYILTRIENDDCIVLKRPLYSREIYIAIDKIVFLDVREN